MRFIEDSGSSFAREQRVEVDTEKKANLFIWFIIILVLLGLNIGSWAFCNMVFGRPEIPFSYRLLTKLDKIKPLAGFSATTAPPGRFYSAKDYYEKIIYRFSDLQLKAYNGMLKRNYLWNYTEKDPASFIYGEFTVEQSRPLNEGDLFTQGLVVRGTAYRYPDGKIDLILPTAEPISPDVVYFEPGSKIQVGRSTMSAAVLHATRTGQDDPVVFQAVPLITKTSSGNDLSFKTPTGETLKLRTPERLNIVSSK